MAFTLQTAKRSAAKLKLAIGGPSGSGKTMSSLLLAYGLLFTLSSGIGEARVNAGEQ